MVLNTKSIGMEMTPMATSFPNIAARITASANSPKVGTFSGNGKRRCITHHLRIPTATPFDSTIRRNRNTLRLEIRLISRFIARKSHSKMRRKVPAVAIVLAAAAFSSYWIWKTKYDEDRPMNMAPLARHMENYVPKYRPEDCLVRLDFAVPGDWQEALNQRIFRNLMRFASEENPQMGPVWLTIKPGAGQMFVQIGDDCLNRFEHLGKWATAYSRRYDAPRFTVSNDIVKPGPDTLEHRGFPWLD